jgi:hypothetical protein
MQRWTQVRCGGCARAWEMSSTEQGYVSADLHQTAVGPLSWERARLLYDSAEKTDSTLMVSMDSSYESRDGSWLRSCQKRSRKCGTYCSLVLESWCPGSEISLLEGDAMPCERFEGHGAWLSRHGFCCAADTARIAINRRPAPSRPPREGLALKLHLLRLFTLAYLHRLSGTGILRVHCRLPRTKPLDRP